MWGRLTDNYYMQTVCASCAGRRNGLRILQVKVQKTGGKLAVNSVSGWMMESQLTRVNLGTVGAISGNDSVKACTGHFALAAVYYAEKSLTTKRTTWQALPPEHSCSDDWTWRSCGCPNLSPWAFPTIIPHCASPQADRDLPFFGCYRASDSQGFWTSCTPMTRILPRCCQ